MIGDDDPSFDDAPPFDAKAFDPNVPPPPPPKGKGASQKASPSSGGRASTSTGAGASSSQQTSGASSSQTPPLIGFTPTPFKWTDPSQFPRRQFLYGRHYARKYVGTTIATGDIGKTSLVLTEFIAMASGKPLLGTHFKGPLKVWYWNGEDPLEEIERRVLAICKYYRLDYETVRGNLFLDSGRQMKIIVAEVIRGGFKIAVPVKDALTKAIIDNKIDVFGVDPFVKTHRIAENDNTLMDAVATLFTEIAEEANSGLELVQHTRKIGGNDATIHDGRGAGSIVAATRMARVANRMSKEEAAQIALPEDQRRFHVRVDAEKSNMAPPERAKWIKLADIGLGNFGPEPGEDEDHVQVATPWKWPDPFENVDLSNLREVQRRTSERPRRKDMRSPEWIGYLIIEVLELDRDSAADKAKAKAIFEGWLKNRCFKTVSNPDKKGEIREFVEASGV